MQTRIRRTRLGALRGAPVAVVRVAERRHGGAGVGRLRAVDRYGPGGARSAPRTRTVRDREPDLATATMPEARPGGADPRLCAACGRPLPARARPAVTRCRVCAAQTAQAYLLEALAARRRGLRPPP